MQHSRNRMSWRFQLASIRSHTPFTGLQLMRRFLLSVIYVGVCVCFVVVCSGGAGNLLVTKYGQVGPGQYLDPSTGKVWTFNHLTRQFGEETDKKQILSEEIEARRAAVQKALESYISDLYTVSLPITATNARAFCEGRLTLYRSLI